MRQLLLAWNTSRHLTATQILHRLVRPLRGRFRTPPKLCSLSSSSFDFDRLGTAWLSAWETLPFTGSQAQQARNRRFRFLNQEQYLPVIDWNCRFVSHLWNYNLHYFDYSIDLARAFRETGDPGFLEAAVELIETWIDHGKRGHGDGWQPYPMSLRIVNWLFAAGLVHRSLPTSFVRKLSNSIALQLTWLEGCLERDVDANHLLKNLKALAIGGMTGLGPLHRRLADFPGRFLKELARQVTPDGLHYERSPMYHAIALTDASDCLPFFRHYHPALALELEGIIARMRRPLQLLSRSDGSLHLFGDAANGIAADPLQLVSSATSALRQAPEPAGDGAWALPASGFYGWSHRGSGEKLVITCSQPSPVHQPGHSHCDILSFELDLGGHPLVVDSGVSGYESDPLREYVRSTRAHNTFGVSGKEQSEMWGTFRVARRARIERAEQEIRQSGYLFRGAYRPYYCSNVLFCRTIEKRPFGWRITDGTQGGSGAQVDSFLHFHPSCRIRRRDEHLEVAFPGGQALVKPFGISGFDVVSGQKDPAQGWYCASFGERLESPALVMRILPSSVSEFGYEIASYRVGEGLCTSAT